MQRYISVQLPSSPLTCSHGWVPQCTQRVGKTLENKRKKQKHVTHPAAWAVIWRSTHRFLLHGRIVEIPWSPCEQQKWCVSATTYWTQHKPYRHFLTGLLNACRSSQYENNFMQRHENASRLSGRIIKCKFKLLSLLPAQRTSNSCTVPCR